MSRISHPFQNLLTFSGKSCIVAERKSKFWNAYKLLISKRCVYFKSEVNSQWFCFNSCVPQVINILLSQPLLFRPICGTINRVLYAKGKWHATTNESHLNPTNANFWVTFIISFNFHLFLCRIEWGRNELIRSYPLFIWVQYFTFTFSVLLEGMGWNSIIVFDIGKKKKITLVIIVLIEMVS